jgi:5,10-methylenetetrahydromethanopterin reductase
MNAPKVPVEVTATGPKMIDLGARLADRIALAVGADPEHLAWAIGTARDAAQRIGRDPATLRIGAYVNCMIHPDRAVARDGVRGTVATFARFSSFAGSNLAKLPGPLRDAAQYLRSHYDMARHTRGNADHARALEDRFIDWFAVAGPSADVLQRFRGLKALGLDFCHVVPGSPEIGRDELIASLRSLAAEIVPQVLS